jgi:hypothetical protein
MIAGYFWLLLASFSFTVWLIYITEGRYPPEPPPFRSQLVARLVGTVGGVVGGWVFNAAFGVPTPQPAFTGDRAASIATGVFIGVTLALGAYRLAAGGSQAARGPQ